MKIIQARNVSEALPEGLMLLHKHGSVRGSRNSSVMKLEEPVVTIYHRPWECCVLWPERRWPTPFMFMEALWMLAGRNDVAWIAQYLPSIKQFSDDGKTLHGAYGHRWRNHFDVDQIENVVHLLSTTPDTRRAVIQMYDARVDSKSIEQGKDYPCNLNIVFSLRKVINHAQFMALDMYVTCRSNDIIWGAYGANAVHFSFLHQYILGRIYQEMVPGDAIPIAGYYHQISIDYHAYVDLFHKHFKLTSRCGETNPYEQWRDGPPPYKAIPDMIHGACFMDDVKAFIEDDYAGPGVDASPPYAPYANNVLRTAWWIREAYYFVASVDRQDRFERARMAANQIPLFDWRLAMHQWLDSRAGVA